MQAEAEANAESPAVEAARRSAQMGLASLMGQGQRLASSGAQALAYASLGQGKYNAMAPALIEAEEAARQRKLLMRSEAQKEMARQQNMKFYDRLSANADRFNYTLGNLGAANARRGAGMGMFLNGVNSVEDSAKDIVKIIAGLGK